MMTIGFVLKSLVALMLCYIGWCFWTVRVPKGWRKPIAFRVFLVIVKVVLDYQEIKVRLGLANRVELRRQNIKHFDNSVRKFKRDHMEIRDVTFSDVKVRLYIPKDAASQDQGHPGLIYFHGGGWVLGHPSSYDQNMSKLISDLNLVIVSVDYRMAPEVVFPGPFQDCVTVTKYFLANAREFGADPERVAIGGDSAGGNLAAAVAIKLRDDDFGPRVKLQLLIYPCLQALDFSLPSMIQNGHGPLLARHDMAWYWSYYICGSDRLSENFLKNNHTSREIKETVKKDALSHNHLDDRYKYKPYRGPIPGDNATALSDDLKDKLLNPYLCPLIAKDLKGVPDAFVFTAEYDLLRDEGILYVKLLRKFGVDVVHSHMECGFHGLWNFIHTYPEAIMLHDDIVKFLKNKL